MAERRWPENPAYALHRAWWTAPNGGLNSSVGADLREAVRDFATPRGMGWTMGFSKPSHLMRRGQGPPLISILLSGPCIGFLRHFVRRPQRKRKAPLSLRQHGRADGQLSIGAAAADQRAVEPPRRSPALWPFAQSEGVSTSCWTWAPTSAARCSKDLHQYAPEWGRSYGAQGLDLGCRPRVGLY